MKKIIFVIAAICATASISYGATLTNNAASNPGWKIFGTPNATGANPVMLGALSKSVTITLNMSANNAGNAATLEADSYALMAYHSNGTKAFGSAAQDTKMYNTDKTTTGWPTLGATDSGAFTAWTSM